MFSKKPETPPMRPQAPRQPVSRPMASSTFSMLGADMAIKGDIAASADLHIDGRVEGDIACASLVQGESSEIAGAVMAQSARMAGTVHGSITARELVILASARIFGDVHYDSLTIEQGAQVEGRFAANSGSPAMAPLADPDDSVEPLLTLASSAD